MAKDLATLLFQRIRRDTPLPDGLEALLRHEVGASASEEEALARVVAVFDEHPAANRVLARQMLHLELVEHALQQGCTYDGFIDRWGPPGEPQP